MPEKGILMCTMSGGGFSLEAALWSPLRPMGSAPLNALVGLLGYGALLCLQNYS